MEREYVGIDFHRRRSVIVRMNQAGEVLSVVRVENDPLKIAAAVEAAGPDPDVVIEATYGWYWIVDMLQDLGATVHLASPKALDWGDRRVKNDVIDATDLADMLRMNRLPEAWIAPPAHREQGGRVAQGRGHVLQDREPAARHHGSRCGVHDSGGVVAGSDRGLRPAWDDVDDLELATLSWVHWFNHERLHGHCQDVPPAEFEAAFYAAQQADPAGVGNQ